MERLLQHRGIIFAGIVGFLSVAIWWLVQGESSPFHDYFLYHVGLGNALARANFPAVLFATVASGNVHQPSESAFFVAMFVQWFVIGWLIFKVGSWVRSRRSGYAS